jgi:tetratricopeptide (TPR) repeat protein
VPLDPVQVVAGFLAALGVPPEQIPTELEQAAARYRTRLADKRVLVVLDNAHDVEQVRPLLPGSPGCLVLVTSRQRLAGLVARDGARHLALDVLTPREAHALLAGALGAERVAAEPDAAAELARLCAWLPLALRIGAANLTVAPQRSLAELVDELNQGNRLAALEVEGDEQATVRAAFDHSYRALNRPARRLFRLLGLVSGPDVSAQAAAALAQITPERAEGLLGRLTDAHLLTQPTPGRYAFHDLLRAYAIEQAHTQDTHVERDQATQRLLDFYLHTTDAAARLLYPHVLRLPLPPSDTPPPATRFDRRARAQAWLDAERPNLVAAIGHAAAHGPRPAAWRLADALRGYFWLRMHTVDWLAVAHAGLAAADADGELRGQAAAHLSLAAFHHRQSEHEHAIAHSMRAAALSQQTGWLQGQSTALGNLGLGDLELGQPQQAADHLTHALGIDRHTGWLAGQAVKLTNRGVALLELGRLHEAADDAAQALEHYRRLGSRSGEAMALTNLGETDHLLGRLQAALDHVARALSLFREVGDRRGEAEILCLLAAVHRDRGRTTRALELAEAAVALARDLGDRKYEASALDTLATIHQRLGRPDQALACAQQALALAHEAGYRLHESHALTTLAGIQLDQGQHQQARKHAKQALDLHRATGQRLGQARSLVTLGRAMQATGDNDTARGHFTEALALFSECGSPEAGQVQTFLRALRLGAVADRG